MSRNRKNPSSGFSLSAAAAIVTLIIVFGAASVGYVWQKSQILDLGKQIKNNEIRLAEIRRQNKIRRDQLDYLRSPAVLDQRVKELNLGLVPPLPGQIITLIESLPAAATSQSSKHLVAAAQRR
ncbi:MAG: hypothetical protein FJ386_04190 [Verrucomicrobia bacterium]|nr:hypothetical protein [Verrucomicrobiota bacterium]